VQREELGRVDDLTRFSTNRQSHWLREGNVLIYVPSVDVDAGVFKRRDGLTSSTMASSSSSSTRAGWSSKNPSVSRSGPHSQRKTVPPRRAFTRIAHFAATSKPADLVEIASDPRQLAGHEVRRLIRQREAAGLDATTHVIELHNRFAFPLWVRGSLA